MKKTKLQNYFAGTSELFKILTGENFTRREIIKVHIWLIVGLVLCGLAGGL